MKISAGDLYDYNLKHTFSQPINLIAEVLGVVGCAYGISSGQPMAIAIGALLVVYLPLTLFLRSSQAAMLPAFRQPLHYRLDEEGLTVTQGEMSESCKWENMVKAVSTSRSILLYTSRVGATIFPRKQIGDGQSALIQVISEHLPPAKVRIRS